MDAPGWCQLLYSAVAAENRCRLAMHHITLLGDIQTFMSSCTQQRDGRDLNPWPADCESDMHAPRYYCLSYRNFTALLSSYICENSFSESIIGRCAAAAYVRTMNISCYFQGTIFSLYVVPLNPNQSPVIFASTLRRTAHYSDAVISKNGIETPRRSFTLYVWYREFH